MICWTFLKHKKWKALIFFQYRLTQGKIIVTQIILGEGMRSDLQQTLFLSP
jgi:hypothetical protein